MADPIDISSSSSSPSTGTQPSGIYPSSATESAEPNGSQVAVRRAALSRLSTRLVWPIRLAFRRAQALLPQVPSPLALIRALLLRVPSRVVVRRTLLPRVPSQVADRRILLLRMRSKVAVRRAALSRLSTRLVLPIRLAFRPA
jgi:hypothetical protein